MQRLYTWAIAAWLFIGNAALGQDALVGTWQGDLAVNPDSKVVVQFIIDKGAGGAYAARLNAPREPNLQNVPVSTVGFDQGQLTLQVDAVSGVYQGKLQDGVIRGTWSQQGASFPLDLVPYVKPALSRESMRRLVGTWHGKLRPQTMPNGLVMVMRFETDAQGELRASFDVPEQSRFGVAAEVSVTADNKLRISHAPMRMEYVADLSEHELTGEFTEGRIGPLPLVLQRGEHKEAPDLILAQESRAKIRGAWHGQLRNVLTLVLRFTESRDGSVDVTLDSPDQGVYGLAVSNVELQGDRLSLAIPGIGATLSATLSAGKMVGQYMQSGQAIPLTLERGEYLGHRLQLPDDVTNRLLGKWEATAANTPLVFRFERDSRGDSFAFIDVHTARTARLPVTGVSVNGAAINFIVKGIEAEFKGQLAANEISGKWITPAVQLPLVIKRSR